MKVRSYVEETDLHEVATTASDVADVKRRVQILNEWTANRAAAVRGDSANIGRCDDRSGPGLGASLRTAEELSMR